LKRKTAEKAQKVLEKEEKRLQKEQRDEEKTLLMLQRQKERERLKQLAVATKTVRTSKGSIKKASAGPSNAYKKPVNPISRAIRATKGPPATPPRSIITDSSPIAGASDLAVAEALNTNRRGRIVALPRRFRE
jgi:hypothetical protein